MWQNFTTGNFMLEKMKDHSIDIIVENSNVETDTGLCKACLMVRIGLSWTTRTMGQTSVLKNFNI